MSAIEQNFLEREVANRIRNAHDFADRERLARRDEPPQSRRHLIRWAILCLAVVGLAFMIFIV